jgi:hypothetical protein
MAPSAVLLLTIPAVGSAISDRESSESLQPAEGYLTGSLVRPILHHIERLTWHPT